MSPSRALRTPIRSSLCHASLLSALAGLAAAQATTRASVDSSGQQASAASSVNWTSPDGRFVLFSSSASDLVPGDTNGTTDVFLRDRQLGSTERVSVGTNGVQLNGYMGPGYSSEDARYIAFRSNAMGYQGQLLVHDRVLNTTETLNPGQGGVPALAAVNVCGVSADGNRLLFTSYASNLVPNDPANNNVFVYDRAMGTTICADVNPAGVPGNGDNFRCSISANGRFVAFDTYASDILPGDTNNHADVFVRDLQNGTTQSVSLNQTGAFGNGDSQEPSITPDGRFVAFSSHASDLVSSDTNAHEDVFVRDLQLGTTELLSLAWNGSQGGNDSFANGIAISNDGRLVAFGSLAANLVPGDTNNLRDVFVRDRQLQTTTRVSVDSNGQEAIGDSNLFALAVGGGQIAFASTASNLVPGDTNGVADVFVHEIGSQTLVPFCFGDSTASACPCGNYGAAFHGCGNSSSSNGALLAADGAPSLSADTLVLASSGEVPGVSSILLQGSSSVSPSPFGDGQRCVGGNLKRLSILGATGDTASFPPAGGPSISAASLARGDALGTGAVRYYQVYYRDPSTTFCPAPSGNAWNISSGMTVVWQQ